MTLSTLKIDEIAMREALAFTELYKTESRHGLLGAVEIAIKIYLLTAAQIASRSTSGADGTKPS